MVSWITVFTVYGDLLWQWAVVLVITVCFLSMADILLKTGKFTFYISNGISLQYDSPHLNNKLLKSWYLPNESIYSGMTYVMFWADNVD
jgi:hypothetical protein